jgi:TP901 family phage tail tape measure protein
VAFAETQNLVVKIDLKGNLQSGLSGAARSLQGLEKATSNTQRSLGKFSQNIQRGVVVGAAAVGGAILGVVKAASDYESAFAGVRKTVNASAPELEELSKQFRQMSKEIPISASELARLGEAGGALGVPTDQLKEFVRVTALLGVTTNLTADEAADSLGVLGNVLHLTGAEYSKFASSLVALGNAGASTERDIVAIAERAGAAGELIGLSTEQVLGLSSAVASLGIESEAGGTSLQKFFIDSAKGILAGGTDLKTFAKVAGVSAKTFQTAFQKDAGGALRDFLKGLGKLSQVKQLQVLKDLGFEDSRITRTLLGLANNTALVTDQMNVANTAFKENTALTKEAETRFNTFDSQLQITKNTLTDMAITIGSKLLPKITPLLKRLNEFVNANQDKIAAFGDSLATGFEKFATALQKVNWQPFIDGLKLSSDIAGKALGIFRSLPTELQAGLVAGFAVNKVTGGLPVAIAKDAGSVLIERLAQRGSSPANAMWVQQVGGLGGAGGAAGAGKLGAIAGVIQKVAIVGIVAEVASLLARPVVDAGASLHDAIFGTKGDPFSDFGKAWTEWRAQADWPFGQKNAPEWAGGSAPPTKEQGTRRAGVTRDDLAIRQIEAMENRTGIVNGKVQVVLDAIRQQLVTANVTLRTSKDPAAIAAAAIAAANSIVHGAGSSKTTQLTLVGLKSALKNVPVSDTKTRAALKTAIANVEKKVPGREFVQKQLTKADQILRSGQTTAQKIAALQAIEKSLGGKSLKGQEAVRAKMESVRLAARDAGRHMARAIDRKKMSTTVNVSVAPPAVSIRQFITGSQIVSRYGTVGSAGGTTVRIS